MINKVKKKLKVYLQNITKLYLFTSSSQMPARITKINDIAIRYLSDDLQQASCT